MPPYIYTASAGLNTRLSSTSDGIANQGTSNTNGESKDQQKARVPFFTVDCNSDDTYLISLDGIQYKLRMVKSDRPDLSKFPTGTYLGDNLTVAIRRGKLLSRSMDGTGVLDEEYEVRLSIKLGNSAQIVRGIYRGGP